MTGEESGGDGGSQKVKSAPVGGSGTTTGGVGSPPVNAGMKEIALDTNRVMRQNLQVSRQQVTKLGEVVDVLDDIKYGIENLARNEANASLKGGRKGGSEGVENAGKESGGGGILDDILESLGLGAAGGAAYKGLKSLRKGKGAAPAETEGVPERYQFKEKAGRWVDTEKGRGGGEFISDAERQKLNLPKEGPGVKPAEALKPTETIKPTEVPKPSPALGAAAEESFLGSLGKGAMKIVGKAALPVLAAYACWEAYQQIKQLNPTDPNYRKNIAKIIGDLIGRFGITTVATILGTIAAGVVSGPGAIVGFIGGLGAGLAADYMLGDSTDKIVNAIIDKLWPSGAAPVAKPSPASDQKIKGRSDRDQTGGKTSGITDLRSEYQQSTKEQSAAESNLSAFEEEQKKSGSKFTEKEDEFSYGKIKTYSDPETQKKYKELQDAEYKARSKKTDIFNKARIRVGTGKDELGKDDNGFKRSASTFGNQLEDSVQMVEALIDAGYTIDELQKLGGGANKDAALKIGEYSFNPGAIQALYNKVIEKTLNAPSDIQDPKKKGAREDRDRQGGNISKSVAREDRDHQGGAISDTGTAAQAPGAGVNRLESASGVAGVNDKLINADSLTFTSKEIKFSAQSITFEQTESSEATPGVSAGPSGGGGGSVPPSDVVPYNAREDRDRQGGPPPAPPAYNAKEDRDRQGSPPPAPVAAPTKSAAGSGSTGAGAGPAGGPAGGKPVAKPNLVRIKTKGGKSAEVAGAYAKNFQGFIDELESSGYNIRRLGGYADRANVNNPKVKSYHASGAAIDINDDTNPNNSRKTDLPSNVGAIAARYGLGWGMNFSKTPDPMHFSIAKEEHGSVDIPRNGQIEAGEAAGGSITGGGGDSTKTGDKLGGGGGTTMAMATPTTGSTLMSKSQDAAAPDIKAPSAPSSGTASPNAPSGGGSSGSANLLDNKEVPAVRPSDQVIARMFDSRAFAA